ncbi:MAG: hypothetical protein FWF51_11340, partial [Chitinivibrionia bacterium]|nr:hypothetical protein [Chitinivibrionia bacterium]
LIKNVLTAITIAVAMASAQSIDLTEFSYWYSVHSNDGSTAVVNVENANVSFNFNVSSNGSWANVGIGGWDWRTVTSIDVTYTSNKPIKIILSDALFVNGGTYEASLPATDGSPVTKRLAYSDFAQESWTLSSPDIPNPTLQSRLKFVDGIQIGAVEAGATQGSIGSLIVNGLEWEDFTDSRDLISPKWKQLWSVNKDDYGSSAAINTNDGNLNIKINKAGDWTPQQPIWGAETHVETAGDWSNFKGIEIHYIADRPFEVQISDPIFWTGEIPALRVVLPAGDHTGQNAYYTNLGGFQQPDDTPVENRKSIYNLNPVAINVTHAQTQDNSNGVGETNIKITKFIVRGVKEEDVNVVWDEQTVFAYNGGWQVPKASAALSNGFPLDIWVENGGTNPGQYTATAKYWSPAYTFTNTTKNFTITKADISPILKIEGTVTAQSQLNPVVIGNLGAATPIYSYCAVENGEYKAEFPTGAGTYFAKATIPATDYYNGATTPPAEFAIVAQNAAPVAVEWGSTVFAYDGTMKAPTAKVKRPGSATRYIDLIVGGEINAGNYTATARLEFPNANFKMTETTKAFTITKRALTQNMLSAIGGFPLTGKQITPSVEVKDDEKVLREGIDYEVSYGENVQVGTGSVSITGKGNYSGVINGEFPILASGTGAIFADVVWGNKNLTYNKNPQKPTATAKDFFGNTYPLTIVGEQTDAGTYTAAATTADKNVILRNRETNFTIAPKPVAVNWGSKRSFTFDKMTQHPVPSVSETGVAVRIKKATSAAGNHTNSAEIVSENANNYTLTGNSVEYEITKEELAVELPEQVDVGGDVANEGQLRTFLNTLLEFNGFRTDTMKIADISDDKSVLDGNLQIIINKNQPQASAANHFTRSQGVVENYKVQVVVSAANYALPSGKQEFNIDVSSPSGITSIEVRKSDSRHGIRFAENIVKDKLEITDVKLPVPNSDKTESPKEIKVIIYDNTGNMVFSGEGANAKLWDLRNKSGRFVANGSYLVIVEAKSANGKTYWYSAKIGVKR